MVKVNVRNFFSYADLLFLMDHEKQSNRNRTSIDENL
jgi:hypothetical protein